MHAWRLKVVPGLIEVRADRGRFRPTDDPGGRGLHLGSGAVLVNLRLAAAQLGHAPVVRLLPDVERPTLLATVRLVGRHRVSRDERLLYAATLRPFAPPVPGSRPSVSVVNELGEAARLEGARLHVLPAGPGDGVRRALLTTRGDSPAEWLRAGQALQRVLLTGTVRSVSTSFAFGRHGLPHVVDPMEPGEVPQVSVTFAGTAPVRLLKAPIGGQDEREGHWDRIR
ncbi:hypothetical protein [Actinomadura sp. CNU-125]|uniref:hypothetical protein n=1 Tax=Actinomadura sp. CNU-125 TaxID=1904961 RepID=UPI0021CCD7EE|nr:hypothetical protein [Actinomadura sp. CNU-125]